MILFGDKDNKASEPKKRSLLGLLFNPRIDRDIAPLRESVAMFVRFIAMVFASYRLFPKDHPAMKDMTQRLTLRDVIGIAYGNLTFTRETLPQTIMFFAVVGILAFSALFIIMFLMSLFMGTAHAADGAVFESPASKDWGLGWIDYLFTGKPIEFGTDTGTLTPDCSMLGALGSALSFYSTAVLVLAGLLLLYHLVFMVAETAHTGKPMGRANQIWAPIRLVVAIGLLVPIASGGTGTGIGGGCQVTGYNTGQYLAMQVARWGSGLASNVWAIFLDSLSKPVVGCSGDSDKSPSCVPMTAQVGEIVKSATVSAACAAMVQQNIKDMGIDVTLGPEYTVTVPSSTVFTTVGEHYFGLSGGSFWNFKSSESKRICGGLSVPNAPITDYSSVVDVQRTALASSIQPAIDFGTRYGAMLVPTSGAALPADSVIKAEYKKIIDDIKTSVETAISPALATQDASATAKLTQELSTRASETGWLMAGTWFNSISRMHAHRVDSLKNGLPTPIYPAVYDAVASKSEEGLAGDSELAGVYERSVSSLKDFSGMIDHAASGDRSAADVANADMDVDNQGFWGNIVGALRSTNPFQWVLIGVDKVGGLVGLWKSGDDLGIKFGAATTNPLGELAAFGQNNISAAQWCLSAAGALHLGSFVIGKWFGGDDDEGEKRSEKRQGFLTAAAGVLTTMAIFFFIIGFTLAFLVPLFPFFKFFFASLKWIMTVFESVVSMPLFALAHVNPYGEGISGDQAKYGYSVLTNLLLRPVLMVLGLVAGYMIFGLCLLFLNEAFTIAARGSGSWSGGTALIAKMSYSVIYCFVVLILANECFSTIGLFPQVALSWIGKQGIKEENFDTSKLVGAGAFLSGKFAGQGIGAISKVQQLPNTVKAASDKIDTEHYTKSLAKYRHDHQVWASGDQTKPEPTPPPPPK